jgi:hypothetical protein
MTPTEIMRADAKHIEELAIERDALKQERDQLAAGNNACP